LRALSTLETFSVTVTNNVDCSASASVLVMLTTYLSNKIKDIKASLSPIPTDNYLYLKCAGGAINSLKFIDKFGRTSKDDLILHSRRRY
jgi:hypothetical protein